MRARRGSIGLSRRIVPAAVALVYESEYEADMKCHFPIPIALLDEGGEEIELDDASADAATMVGDLETLLDVAPGVYLAETHLVF